MTTDDDAAATAAIYKRLYPRAYLERFLHEGIRPDGRAFDECRPCSSDTGSVTTADGSSLVRVGQTTMMCTVRVETAEPDLMRPDEGFLIINAELMPIASSQFLSGPPSDDAQVLASRLRQVISSSNMLPLRKLGIRRAKAVLVVYVDVACLSFDGNALDVAVMAVTQALYSARIPVITFEEENNRVIASASLPREPLKLSEPVLTCSFALFGQTVLSDPTDHESAQSRSLATVALSRSGMIRYVLQSGHGVLQADRPHAFLQECIGRTKKHLASLWQTID
ncbi:uncharacterized protein L969DRAFT_88717 [Mixia osmundae IAM 14324]|uniref:Ribosomal RNA-processing protein 43 n=1 Tax=Mixia osmundae (strain CBS 9802 / IAM 14324 / JCM 22182 / KY 12970) TaxID=764103 RepID=G7DZ66_MIXOS|nr:uncharacterized protein L969DRAFT_88717 [Mixia osmundae IAM 14324]KEI38277.1 hypothetical protein L969DRAFT_88717 [Mixia osmundae IAM 14324]GAA95876.1 hypothetical protein E5Q_02533 [Mixia osmundae IAM 14324]